MRELLDLIFEVKDVKPVKYNSVVHKLFYSFIDPRARQRGEHRQAKKELIGIGYTQEVIIKNMKSLVQSFRKDKSIDDWYGVKSRPIDDIVKDFIYFIKHW